MKKRECYLVGGGLGNTGVAGARQAAAAPVSQGQAGPGSSAHIHYHPGPVLCTQQYCATLALGAGTDKCPHCSNLEPAAVVCLSCV